MAKIQDITADSVNRRLRDRLSLKVGPHKQYSDKELEIATGISERAIRGYRNEGKNIPLENVIKTVVGIDFPELLSATLEPYGYAVTPLKKSGVASPHKTLSELADQLRLIAGHLEDGKHTHEEKLKEIKELPSLAHHIFEYVNGLEKETSS